MFTVSFTFFSIIFGSAKKPDEKISAGFFKLISACKQIVSKPVTLNEFKFSSLLYNKHLINRAKSVCMGES